MGVQERKSQCERRELCAKRLEVFSCAKTEKAPQISLFNSPFISVRSFGPQEWSVFFPLFLAFYHKSVCFEPKFLLLKHRIHPKHGSGRTSSLTRSNTRKRRRRRFIPSSCLLRVALLNISRFLFSSSVWCMHKEKEKSIYAFVVSS